MPPDRMQRTRSCFGQKIQLSARRQPAHFNPMTQPATPLLSEPGQIRVLKVICILVCVLSVSCVQGGEGSPLALLSTNTPPQTISPEMTQQSNSNEIKRAALLREALQYADKQAEDRAHGVPLPPSEFPFPAPDAGPHRPPPSYVNLYGIKDNYPNYLECIYDVDEKKYNQSEDPKWFIESLKQTRHFGPERFPPIRWIAVVIQNRAEHKDASTFEQSFKVGAIFRASDVFDSSRDLSQLVTNAIMDRHPFKYDQPQSKFFVGEQRWLIVEQHAATNNPTAGSH
jgi:hypothetical protein